MRILYFLGPFAKQVSFWVGGGTKEWAKDEKKADIDVFVCHLSLSSNWIWFKSYWMLSVKIIKFPAILKSGAFLPKKKPCRFMGKQGF